MFDWISLWYGACYMNGSDITVKKNKNQERNSSALDFCGGLRIIVQISNVINIILNGFIMYNKSSVNIFTKVTMYD